MLPICVDSDGRSYIYVPVPSKKKRSTHQRKSDSTSKSVLVLDGDGLVQDFQFASGHPAEEEGEADVKPDIVAVTPEGCVVRVDGSSAPDFFQGKTTLSHYAKEGAKDRVRRLREWKTVAAANEAEVRLEGDEVFSIDSSGLLRGPVAAAVPRWASFDANGVVRAPRFNDATARLKLFCLKKRLRNRRGQRDGDGTLPLCIGSDGKSYIYVPVSSKKKRLTHQRKSAHREEVSEAIIIVDEAGVIHE